MGRTPTQLLAEIKAATNLSEKAIGDRIGCSQPTVNRILKGHMEFRTSTLMAILRLHAEVTRAGEAEAA